MKIKLGSVKKHSKTVILIASALIGSCSDGINRDDIDTGGSSGPGTLDDGSPADPSYVKFSKVEYTSEQPSLVSILFQATDSSDRNIDSLSIDNFQIEEDDELIPASESASIIISRVLMPFTMDTVVMLDISSSITATDLANMKQAVNELVRDPTTGNSRLFPGQRVSIYTFNDTLTKIKGFSSSPSQIIKSMERITLPNTITPTDLYGALQTGVSLWQTSNSVSKIHQGSVILITDGTDTAGRYTLSETLKSIEEKNVITVGVGETTNIDVLEDLGTADSFSVANFGELSGVLASIRERLNRFANSFYLLKYASPKRAAQGKVSNSDHTFQLEIIDNDNSKSSGKISGDFNSYEFSNVTPRVVIGGPTQLESDQAASYVAETYWASNNPSFSWSFGGDCSLDKISAAKITIKAINTGNCQISVTDDANDSVFSNISISVVSN